ncbi:ADP-ribose glycohydrolase OARD1-like [Musca vetustissima]|uniref:ADP-ribose glycohydrolase OARD1-like n=1 Tax=Musca vetustissima TaxID=27455 RepID=UPI002AB6DBC8|nr:ADP-ribose glycohydrolase OARD1-like [Musca vetustissima]XP_061393053.1 ADP-ribose glycohydrolase OARD1-like [Musca vetustissima]
MSFSLKEIYGDLFSAGEDYSMAHCVAADLRMGKGIAVKFRSKFGSISLLQKQNVKPGGVAILPHNSRYIYNLVTKETSWGKPTYQLLHSSLVSMRNHMIEHDVTKLAMPRIGCGLDGLTWHKVKDLIEEVFSNDPVSIVIFNYSPTSISK